MYKRNKKNCQLKLGMLLLFISPKYNKVIEMRIS